MARELSIKGSFKGQALERGLKETQKTIENIKNTGKEADKSLNDMLREKNGASNYKRQLRSLQKQLEDMVITYRLLSDEDRKSEFGVNMSKQIDELTRKLGTIKDSIGDVSDAIKNESSDTLAFDAMKDGIDAVVSGMQTFVGISGLSKGTVESLTRALTAMKVAETGLATAIKIKNAVQDNSAIMRYIKSIQAQAAATYASATATGTATAAQKLFNIVAKANPYVLLATGAVALGAALLGLSGLFGKLNSEMKASQKAQRDWNATEIENDNEIAKAVSLYLQLEREYNKLSNDSQKVDGWISKNRQTFEDLGLAIKNSEDAAKAFNNISTQDALVKMQEGVQGLKTYYEQMVVQRNEIFNKHRAEFEKSIQPSHSYKKEWDAALIKAEEVKETLTTINSRTVGPVSYTTYTLTQDGIDKLKRYYEQLGEDDFIHWRTGFEKKIVEAQNEITDAIKLSPFIIEPGTEQSITSTEGSIEQLEKKISELQDKQKRLATNTNEYKVYQRQIDSYQSKIDAILAPIAGSIAYYKQQIAKLEERQALATNSADFQKITKQIETFKDKISEIEKPIDNSLNDYRNRIAKLQELAANATTDAEAQAYLREINALETVVKKRTTLIKTAIEVQEELKKAQGKVEVGISTDTDSLNAQIKIWEDYAQSIYDSVDSIDELTEEKKKEIAVATANVKVLKAEIDKLKEVQELSDFHVTAKRVQEVQTDETTTLRENRVVKVTMPKEERAVEEKRNQYERLISTLKSMEEEYDKLKSKDPGTLNLDDKAFVDYFENAKTALAGFEKDYNSALDRLEQKQLKLTKINIMDGLVSNLDSTMNSIDTMVSGFFNLEKTLEQIEDNADMSEPQKAWEKFMTVFSACMNVLNTGVTIIEAVNNVMEIANTISELAALRKAKETAANVALAGSEVAAATATGTATASKTAETVATDVNSSAKAFNAITGAMSSLSSIPIVGVALAIAGVAALIAVLMASKNKFATGGIVGGNSYVGDNQLVRVNSGEMILNSRQQANLFKLLDGSFSSANNGTNAPTDVRFHIEGDTLVGAITNYNKRRGRI